ncbi:Hypothetical predicted protein [Olea europaea subsp. europaea]|nr:Hypothetical predicted protein [Olea europaea subsp. europaea]
MTSLGNKEPALSLVKLTMICFYLMLTTTQLGMQKSIGDVLDSVGDLRGALNAFKEGYRDRCRILAKDSRSPYSRDM